MKIGSILTAALVVAGAAPGNATVISGLFNTGTDAAGVALVGGNGVVDPHYIIVSSTSGAGFAGQSAVTYYNAAYPADDANSRWVSISPGGAPGNNTTVYRTTFDLTGLDPATAHINGRFAADNNIGTILLRNRQVGRHARIKV